MIKAGDLVKYGMGAPELTRHIKNSAIVIEVEKYLKPPTTVTLMMDNGNIVTGVYASHLEVISSAT